MKKSLLSKLVAMFFATGASSEVIGAVLIADDTRDAGGGCAH